MQAITKTRLWQILAISAALTILSGCGPNDFNYGKVRNIIEGSPQRLDAEYVMLSAAQFECGVQEELWGPSSVPVGMAGATGTARVLPKGNQLKFSDDVMVGEKRYPYVQVRGDFSLAAIDITNDKSGGDEFSRFVDAKIGVIISHTCFKEPLQIMGVRKGQFTQDYSPVLLFKYNNGWALDSFVHN
jgi:hypothetical protein